jgi:putative nucleotidyltransferase with HDIG domain
MTQRADGRHLLLIGGEDGPGLLAFTAAVRDDPTLVPVGRIEDPDSAHDGPDPLLVVLDMSVLDSDVAVSAVAKAVLRWPRAGVLAIAASAEPALVRSVLDAGAQSVMLRDADHDDVRAAVAAAAEGRGLIDVDVVRPTIDLYAVLLAESRRRDRAVIESLAAAVEAKDSVTSRHLRRVSRLATQLAELVDPAIGRTEEFLFGCLLHDVGKIGVPEDILSKPGPLTEEEWDIMRRHPQIGARVVRPLGLSEVVVDVVLYHHERWDGAGYPQGLSGDDIPLVARIFSVCDALEAMTAMRRYRDALPASVAYERVKVEAGTQFDPAIVRILDRGVSSGVIDLDDPTGAEPDPGLPRRFARDGLVGFHP